MNTQKRILSGVQPSGNLTLGNYLGALKNFDLLQNDYECIYCIVDLHTLTVRQIPEQLRERTYSVLALYIACGVDAEKNILFAQSHVTGHAELAWILNCFAYTGELNRMTQFKDKSSKHADNVNSGLYTYPVLMAADILLYQTDLVPIGQDQKQHLELSRDIAERFNNLYGNTFIVPEPYIPKTGAKIMSLQEPDKKMSKSDTNENNYILINEDPTKIIKKFKKSVTDSETEIRYDEENKAGISNLINIYASMKNITRDEVVKEFSGFRYSDFKVAVGTTAVELLTPIRERYDELIKDKTYLDKILKDGAERARAFAKPTLEDVYRKLGLITYSNSL